MNGRCVPSFSHIRRSFKLQLARYGMYNIQSDYYFVYGEIPLDNMESSEMLKNDIINNIRCIDMVYGLWVFAHY